MERPILQEYQTLHYSIDQATGYFIKDPDSNDLSAWPTGLRIEKTYKPFLVNQGINSIIKSRNLHEPNLFFCGLKSTGVPDTFTGSHYNAVTRIKYRVVFQLSSDNTRLVLFIFNWDSGQDTSRYIEEVTNLNHPITNKGGYHTP